jgi:hypothetical protein
MDEAAILQALKDGVAQQKDFLILEKDELYIQFAFSPDHIWMEIASNEFLPAEKHLTEEKMEILRSKGFDGGEEANFCKSFQALDDNALQELAKSVVEIFTQIFGLPLDAEINLNLD